MKTFSTFKNRLTPNLFFLSALILLISTPVFSQVKHVISVTKNKFTPNEIKISVGDTIEWKNTDGFHNVNGTQATYPMNPESFGNTTGTGWTYSHVFTMSGKYDYQCDPHVELGMIGKIEVSDKGPMKHIVGVTKNVFTPANLVINRGDTVEWRNTDGFHNVNGTQATYPMNPESFGNSSGTGWTYSHVFTMSGKYDYQCDPHVGLGMIGKIEVADKGPMKHIVGVTKNVFTPANLVINRGDTVEWRNTDGFHNVNGTQATYPLNPESFGNNTGTGWTYSHVFTMSGKYDYQCDPHVGLGMIGIIEVEGTDDDGINTLTVNFSGMNPHVGQTLWLAVIDKDSGKEIERKSEVVSIDFSMQISGLEINHSYNVNFFADHNGNGQYDMPPADHAWRMELNDVMGDTTLNFQHNTSFTDIMWKNKLMVHFMGMNPHVGQNLQLAVIEKTTGMEVQRVSLTASVDFWVSVYGIENGMSYNVDFYADHNSNGMYDAPPADHAWRMELNDVMGDTTLMFQHNTSFTDINWISTAISELNNSSFKMYPNPATGRVFIESNEFNSNVVKVMIYDISGKLKLSKIHSPQQLLEIDIHELVNGMYFVELRNDNKREMLKLIKY